MYHDDLTICLSSSVLVFLGRMRTKQMQQKSNGENDSEEY